MDCGQHQADLRQNEIRGADDRELKAVFRQAVRAQHCEYFLPRETSHGMSPPTAPWSGVPYLQCVVCYASPLLNAT
jgi:hypothetical protein